MRIGGIQKTTLIDYPGKLAATIFVSGCNFRCPFCYNPDLVLPEEIEKHPSIPPEDVLTFLKERKKFLSGVVLGGGEPTIYDDLPDFAKEIKQLGYLIKLDTNGYNPEILQKMIKEDLLNYIAMDIKAPKEKYIKASGKEVEIERIEESIQVLKKSKIDYEFRTTVVPGLLAKKDILKIAQWIKPAAKYFLQTFQNTTRTVDPDFMKIQPYSDSFLQEVLEEIKPYFDICQIR